MCETCGTTVGPFEAHHIRPRGDGGGDEIENLSCQCGGPKGCHTKITQGKIRFKRNIDLIPPEDIDTVIDDIFDEFTNEGGEPCSTQ